MDTGAPTPVAQDGLLRPLAAALVSSTFNLPADTTAAAMMVGTGIACLAEARRIDKPAAAAGLPFVAWAVFTTVLTAAIWRRNR